MGKNENDCAKILSYFEVFESLETEKIVELVNKDLRLKSFLVSYNVTAADIFAYAHVVQYVKGFTDIQKNEQNNIFRWINQLQHCSGIEKYVNENNLFISFLEDNKNIEEKKEIPSLSKNQLKKLAKLEIIKQKKAEKAAKRGNFEENKDEKAFQNKPKQKKNNLPQKKKGEVDYTAEPASLIDFKVGHIIKVWIHPDSDYLYCCYIDIGEDQPRSIATGLQKFYQLKH